MIEFDHLGVFIYSPEEGTPAVGFPDRVQKEISAYRRNMLMKKQGEISLRKN